MDLSYTGDSLFQIYHAQENFDCYVKYGAVCAVSGVADNIMEALRKYAVHMAIFWGLDPPMQNLQKFYKAFDDAVSQAKETGQAEALTISEKVLMLKGLSYYAYNLYMQGGDDGIYIAQYLAQRLKDEWTMQKPDSAALCSALPVTKEMNYLLLSKIRQKSVDGAYFQNQDKIAKSLLILPEYAAYLLSEGRKAEAVKVEALGYDMVCSWYDKLDIMSTIISPDTYLDQIAALNPEQSRTPDQSEMQILYDGILTHASRMQIDTEVKVCQMRKMCKTFAAQIEPTLEKAGRAEPKAVQGNSDYVPQSTKKAKKRKPER